MSHRRQITFKQYETRKNKSFEHVLKTFELFSKLTQSINCDIYWAVVTQVHGKTR